MVIQLFHKQNRKIFLNHFSKIWFQIIFSKLSLFLILFGFSLPGCSVIVKDTATLRSVPPSLKIVAVGDTNGYNIQISSEDPLESVKQFFIQHDIFIFNAEGIFLPEPHTNCYGFPPNSVFVSSPRILDFLQKGKITIASLANNHILDCGTEGLLQTIYELRRREIMTIGAGKNLSEACTPLRLDINGMRIAILAYLSMEEKLFYADLNEAGAASWERCNGQKQISELKDEVDVILVILHSHIGEKWSSNPHPESIFLIQSMLDAGADLVIASGPHVPQGIMKRDGGIALLSLGNFLFRPDYRMPEKSYHSILSEFIITSDSIKLILVPLKIEYSGIPTMPSVDEALNILANVFYQSYEFDTGLEMAGQTGYLEIIRKQR
jgi:hypothetical protein